MKLTTFQVIRHPLGWALTKDDADSPQKNRVLSVHPTEAEALLNGERFLELLEFPLYRQKLTLSSESSASPWSG